MKKILLTLLIALFSFETQAININPDNRQPQVWDGWGVSLCWWANMCGRHDEQHLDSLISWLTSPEGLNYNIFRYNIGGGDDPEWKNCEPHHMGRGKGLRAEMEGFLDSADGQYVWERDEAQRRVMLLIRKQRPDAIFEAFSNSCPWWMTISGCVAGNKPGNVDNLKKEYYGTFAHYLVDVCRHYKDKYGLEFATLEPFNEALTDYWKQSDSQEGCHFDSQSQIDFLRVLAPVLQSSGLKTVISASDETSVGHSISNFKAYKDAGVLPLVGQWNTHTYGGSLEERMQLRSLVTENTSVKLYQSETGDGGRGLHGNLRMAQRLINDIRYLQPSAWLDWQYVEENYDQWSLVKCDHEWKDYIRHKNYYVRQHFSRFVPAGYSWLNIDDKDAENVLAAVNADGTAMTIVMLNTSRNKKDMHFELPKGWRVDECYRTSNTESMAPCKEIFPSKKHGNSIVTALPPISIVTVTLKR